MLLITGVVGLSIAAVLIRGEQLRTEGERLRADLSLTETRRGSKIAEDNALEATQKAKDLERQDYIHRVNLAYREAMDNNIAAAVHLLDGCPRDLRGWEWSFVIRLCHLDLDTFEQGSHVNAVACSPDGRYLASGGGDFMSASDAHSGLLVVRDTKTGRKIFARDLEYSVQGLGFSPDGRILASVGMRRQPADEGDLTLWDLSTGVAIHHLPKKGIHALCVAFSTDGKQLAVGFALGLSARLPATSRSTTRRPAWNDCPTFPGGPEESMPWPSVPTASGSPWPVSARWRCGT